MPSRRQRPTGVRRPDLPLAGRSSRSPRVYTGTYIPCPLSAPPAAVMEVLPAFPAVAFAHRAGVVPVYETKSDEAFTWFCPFCAARGFLQRVQFDPARDGYTYVQAMQLGYDATYFLEGERYHEAVVARNNALLNGDQQ